MRGALPSAFAGLTSEEMMELSACLHEFRFEIGDVIMAQGEEDTSIAFLQSGGADVFLGQSKVGTVGPREMCGEMELFGQMPRLASVVATHTTDLLVLDPDAFVSLAEQGNRCVFMLERAALKRVSSRLGQMNQLAATLTSGSEFKLRPKRKPLVQRLLPFLGRRDAAPEIDKVSALAASPLFSWADRGLLSELASNFEVVAADSETLVCKQGEPANKLFVLVSGEADVVLMVDAERAENIATLGPGMAFGDQGIMLGLDRTASVVAREDSVLLSMDRDHFIALYDMDQPAASVLRQGLLRNLIAQVDVLGQRLANLVEVQGARSPTEDMIRGTPVSMVWRD